MRGVSDVALLLDIIQLDFFVLQAGMLNQICLREAVFMLFKILGAVFVGFGKGCIRYGRAFHADCRGLIARSSERFSR
jgi:hypothetical protein